MSGIATYGFLVVAARALDQDAYDHLAAMWAVMFLVAPGFFLPIEQEVGRALAHRRSRHLGGGPVIRRAARLGGILAAALVVITLALSPVLLDELFGDSIGLLAGFLLGLTGYYFGHLGRGTLSGMRRFSAYGLYMGSEGVIRLVSCGLLAAIGVDAVGPYGIVAGFPPLVAIAIAVRTQRDLVVDGPEAPWSELTANLAYLLAGSVLSAALINAGPIAVKLLSTDADENLTGSFLNAVVITRVPLFLFQAVQASLLPKLAAYAGAGQWDEFRVRFRRLMLFVAAIGVVAIVGSFLLGPFAMRILFGSEYELGRRTMTMLAAAAAGYMVAIGLAQALIALHGHARAALGWAVSMTVLLVAIALGDDLLLRVEMGLVAASVAAAVTFGFLLRPLLGRPIAIDEESLLEAIVDLPMEP